MTTTQFLSNCSADAIKDAVKSLEAGNLVAFPTETVYGLGADATNKKAVSRIYEAKGRPTDHPLIVHVHSLQAMSDWVTEIPTYAIALARQFWPGPMTLILKRSSLAQDFITGGQDTVGIRVPDHVVALALLEAFQKAGGLGVAAPSANRFGHVSPTTAQAVSDELSQYLKAEDQILDGGQCAVGLESTIIDCTSEQPRILRPGAITTEMIVAATGLDIVNSNSTKIRVSGDLASHYSPKALVVLDEVPCAGDGFIAMAEIQTPTGSVRLAAPKTNAEFAQVLYSALRIADEKHLTKIVIWQPIGEDIALAIRDRIRRAANQQ
jgi:L-threonylcarbamoyladenylate synthase